MLGSKRDYPITAASFFPKKIPKIQQHTLNPTYTLPMAYALFSNSLYASRENVEKVVKPPHTPVFQKSTVLGDTSAFLSVNPTTKPIRIAPSILVTNVNMGNCVLTGIKLIAYLATAPSAPPNATAIKFILPLISSFHCVRQPRSAVLSPGLSVFLLVLNSGNLDPWFYSTGCPFFFSSSIRATPIHGFVLQVVSI